MSRQDGVQRNISKRIQHKVRLRGHWPSPSCILTSRSYAREHDKSPHVAHAFEGKCNVYHGDYAVDQLQKWEYGCFSLDIKAVQLTAVVLITPLRVAVCCGPKTRMTSGGKRATKPIGNVCSTDIGYCISRTFANLVEWHKLQRRRGGRTPLPRPHCRQRGWGSQRGKIGRHCTCSAWRMCSAEEKTCNVCIDPCELVPHLEAILIKQEAKDQVGGPIHDTLDSSGDGKEGIIRYV